MNLLRNLLAVSIGGLVTVVAVALVARITFSEAEASASSTAANYWTPSLSIAQ